MRTRILLFCFALLSMSSVVNAQEFDYPLNAAGDIEFLGEFESQSDIAKIFANARVWAISNNHIIASEKPETGELIISCNVRGRSAYNPFAGMFQETIQFVLTLNCSDNKVSYVMSNFKLTEVYTGYGTKTTVIALVEKLKILDKAKQDKKDAEANLEMKRKQQKDIIDDCEDTIAAASDSLFEAYKSITALLELLKNDLSK